MVIYALAQAVNYLHTALIIRLFLGVFYTLNVFNAEIIVFISKKVGHIAKQIERLNATKTKLVDNRKLSRLIVEYNRVLFELIQMNNFFKVTSTSFKRIYFKLLDPKCYLTHRVFLCLLHASQLGENLPYLEITSVVLQRRQLFSLFLIWRYAKLRGSSSGP